MCVLSSQVTPSGRVWAVDGGDNPVAKLGGRVRRRRRVSALGPIGSRCSRCVRVELGGVAGLEVVGHTQPAASREMQGQRERVSVIESRVNVVGSILMTSGFLMIGGLLMTRRGRTVVGSIGSSCPAASPDFALLTPGP